MCQCNPNVGTHFLFRVAVPTANKVGSYQVGVGLTCEGKVESIGGYIPDDTTARLWNQLAMCLSEMQSGLVVAGIRSSDLVRDISQSIVEASLVDASPAGQAIERV